MIQNTYTSAYQYIRTCSDLKGRIDKIRQVIDGLFDAAIASAENVDIQEYSVDTGQTKIKTSYRSAEEVNKALAAYIQLEKTMIAYYNNQRLGSVIQLIDRKSFYVK